MSNLNKYLDLSGLSHYNEKVNETFVKNKNNIVEKEIENLFDSTTEEGEESNFPLLENVISKMILDKLYPIGSIYLETTNTNPSTLLGGTWEAYGASDTYLRLGNSSNGGSNSYSLTSANIPSHTHSIGAHSHGLNSHTHGVGSYSTGASTAYDTSLIYRADTYGSSNLVAINWGGTLVGGDESYRNRTIHNHTVTGTSGAASGSTTNSTAFNSGSYGSATVTAVSIEPKYVGVYAWKRIA